jgi:hypothetical protein
VGISLTSRWLYSDRNNALMEPSWPTWLRGQSSKAGGTYKYPNLVKTFTQPL